jgi:RNA polymerase sigma factor (sigma-70 family)
MAHEHSDTHAPRSPVPQPDARPDADEIYRAHASLLRRIATRKFGVPPADAEPLVHDVFIDYLAHPQNVRSDLRAYLIASICNASRNYWRAKKSECNVFDEAPLHEPIAESKDLLDELMESQLAAEVLLNLDSRCREVLRRYYMEEERTGSIAEALGTSSSNVNYLMHICRKNARALYERMVKARWRA